MKKGNGILNWCIAGLDMLLRDVDQTGDIALTDQQRNIVDSLLAESDSLRGFLVARVEKAAGADITVNEIVEAYAALLSRNELEAGANYGGSRFA